jgi:hypothetical protein
MPSQRGVSDASCPGSPSGRPSGATSCPGSPSGRPSGATGCRDRHREGHPGPRRCAPRGRRWAAVDGRREARPFGEDRASCPKTVTGYLTWTYAPLTPDISIIEGGALAHVTESARARCPGSTHRVNRDRADRIASAVPLCIGCLAATGRTSSRLGRVARDPPPDPTAPDSWPIEETRDGKGRAGGNDEQSEGHEHAAHWQAVASGVAGCRRPAS